MVYVEGSPEHYDTSPKDPIAALLYGESLVAAGRLNEATYTLDEAIHKNKRRLETCPSDYDTVITDLILRYSHADVSRLCAARAYTLNQRDMAQKYMRVAHEELYQLKNDLAEPNPHHIYQPTPDHDIIANAMRYLVLRSEGLLDLSCSPYEQSGTHNLLLNAHMCLIAADSVLATGIWQEKCPPPPALVHPDDLPAQTAYIATIALERSELRRRRRATDPQLAIALLAAETTLNRRGPNTAATEKRLPVIVLPDFTLPGPAVSHILDIA